MTSTSSASSNLKIVEDLCVRAKAGGASMLALPECFSFIGSQASETLAQATSLTGDTFSAFRDLAKKHSLWLSCGGFHERVEDEDKVYNAHVVVDSSGCVNTVYRKMHLFDVAIPGGAVLMESKTTRAGDPQAIVVETPVGRVGLTTCYDLRFPELYIALAKRGADVILVPSAFTVPTGAAHWHLLLRARAVESQCYIAAAAQVGVHSEKRQSYGHALAVDPWGDVLADAGQVSPNVVFVDIDTAKIDSVRTKMPIQKHRRRDVLDLLLSDEKDDQGE